MRKRGGEIESEINWEGLEGPLSLRSRKGRREGRWEGREREGSQRTN